MVCYKNYKLKAFLLSVTLTIVGGSLEAVAHSQETLPTPEFEYFSSSSLPRTNNPDIIPGSLQTIFQKSESGNNIPVTNTDLAQVITPRPPESLPEDLPESQPNPLEPVTPTPPESTPLPEFPGDFCVQGFNFTGNTAFTSEELSEAVADFLSDDGECFSFAELLQVETILNQKYQDDGYINSGVVIPSRQNVDPDNAIIEVQITEGEIEAINVRTSGRLNPGYVESRLAIAAQKPLNQQRILEALQLLQLNPLIDNISAELTAGSRREFSILEVDVTEADSFRVEAFIDNGRTPSVGSFRRGVRLEEGNLLGFGDSLRLSYANTDGSNAGDFLYTVPVSPYDTALSFGFGVRGTEVVEPPFDILDIEGRSYYVDFTVRQPVFQKPTQELALGLTFSRQESETELLDTNFSLSPGAIDGETRVSALRFFQEYTYRTQQELFALRSQFSLGIDAFDATVADDKDDPDAQFFAWRGQAQYVRLLAPETLLIVRSDVQFAGDGLVSLEQIGVGGLNSVRGYRQDLLLTDNGIFISAEVRVPVVRFDDDDSLLQVVPFFDFGTGWNFNGDTNPEDNTLIGIGVGLQLDLQDWLSARLDYGIPLNDFDDRDRTIQEQGLYFSLTVSPF